MSKEPLGLNGLPSHDYFRDAVHHIDEAITSKTIASSAAKGLVYSLVETLGSMVGDPDLTSHMQSGYQGALELARELQTKIERVG